MPRLANRALSFYSEGHSVDPSYYKKPAATPAPSQETVKAVVTNKYGLAHVESTKIELKFRELCYGTVERTLSSIFQGTHRSLAIEYLSKRAAGCAPPLSKEELGLRYADLKWARGTFGSNYESKY